MVLDFYDLDDDDYTHVETGSMIVLLIALLSIFYRVICYEAKSEL